MYFKLALKNVKKSYKDYFVYFITLTVSVALFYVFNSFDVIQDVLVLNSEEVMAFRSLMVVMFYLSIFVTFVFGFLILYANNYILKRRKQEIALYTLLGMKKGKIGRILLYETLIVGFISLFLGISLGIILSQGVAAFTANLIDLDIAYNFIISFQAIKVTIISFSIIFIIVGIFNNISTSKTKLIDLFSARRMNQTVKANNPVVMTVIMLVSIIMLGVAYYIAQIPLYLLIFLPGIVLLGGSATFGIFYSLSYWLVRIAQSIKGYYHKDLNTFSTRQISSKINSTYKMLAVVSLMMLVSFGALASAFNVSSIIDSMIAKGNKYDMSISIRTDSKENLDKYVEQINFKTGVNAEEVNLLGSKMGTGDLTETELKTDANGKSLFDAIYLNIDMMEIDDFNKFRASSNLEPITLKENEVVYFGDLDNYASLSTQKDDFFTNDILTLQGVPLNIKDQSNHNVKIANTGATDSLVVVATPETINNVVSNIPTVEEGEDGAYFNPLYTKYINITFDEELDMKETTEYVNDVIFNTDQYDLDGLTISSQSKYNDSIVFKTTTLLMVFIGLYMGLTFLVVSVMVISLQLLSEASDNYERYLLLDKIGVSQSLQKKAIFKQNLIYFALPLIVGLIHSYFGIRAVNVNLAMAGLRTESYLVILGAIGILVAIYLVYFLVTYFSSVRMTFDRKK